MTELSGRQLAWYVLDHIESEDAYANLALMRILRDNPSNQREKAFCTELVYGTMRHRLTIDYILGRLLSRPFVSLNRSVKNILRLAIYQLVHLPGIPPRAVIHSAVEQVKYSKFSKLAALTNGVLRNYLRQKDNIVFPAKERDPAFYYSIMYSMPLWIVERWLAAFGPEITEDILQVSNERPPWTIRINRCWTDDPCQARTLLAAEGIETEAGLFLSEAANLLEMPAVLEEMPSFSQGKFFIQDESSMLVPHLLAPIPGELIFDLCAAPGGKSTHLAELMNNRGRVLAVDDHPHKVELIAENARRMNLDCVQPILGDARHFQPDLDREADGVLVDAPCSGTGVFRRRVDAKYRKRLQDIKELVNLQRDILNQAAKIVKPGGRLIYSTCTLEYEEDEGQIEWFLAQHPQFEVEDYQCFLPDKIKTFLVDPKRPWAKILPISGGGDGFFMCRLKRR